MLANNNTKTIEPELIPSPMSKFLAAWEEYLDEEVGAGAASEDTLKTYTTQIACYLHWCESVTLDPAVARRKNIKSYRHYLSKQGYKKATIALKLTVVRRFYEAAIEAELLLFNPALGVKPPLEKVDPSAQIKYLEIEEVESLLLTVSQEIPDGRVEIDNEVKPLRDLALIEIMLYEGARPIELHRANVGDLTRQGDNLGLRVSSKRKIRLIPLTAKIAALLHGYLAARKQTGEKLSARSPLFAAVGNRSRGERLSRSRIFALVNEYLKQSNLKDRGNRILSPYSLRHTAGTQGLIASGELRRVQELLGHSDPKTTAIYAQANLKWANNPAALWELELPES
ncbi:tyrosine-type recombinase/integrase [Chroococcidiopsis sp.]|uniref:tyrosine-type recombinase/integrase n=1 Tax=Chroococcidiopsis sp. TaxID=3088168 RepID=UPI003F3A5194